MLFDNFPRKAGSEPFPAFFSPKNAINFSTYQAGLQALLEAFGTRTNPIPVVLSILASPQTIAATLRAGGHPILLDVDVDLQMDVDVLKGVLADLPTAVVLLDSYEGQPASQALVEAAKSYPTVHVHHAIPCTAFTAGSFAVFDLSPLGGGGLVYTTWADCLKDLRIIRDGLLGHDSRLKFENIDCYKNSLVSLAQEYTTRVLNSQSLHLKIIEQFSNQTQIKPVFNTQMTYCVPYKMIYTPNAKRVVAHLDSYGIEVKEGCYPLHQVPELRNRWEQTPDYPNADKLGKSVVCLPCHSGVTDQFDLILEKVLEVCNG